MHKKLFLISLFFLTEQTAFAAGNTKNETIQDSEISRNEITSTSTSTSTSIDTQHYFEESSFTYTQEAQQKIQQEINNRSTNPGGCPTSHVTNLILKVKPQSEEEWKALDQKFPHLHVLNAESLGLNTEDITFLVKCFPYLTSLNLSKNQIGDKDAEAIAVNTNWKLQYLNLFNNGIRDAGAQAIAANTNWKLQYLDLGCNHIGNTSALALAANTSWNLQNLNLCQNLVLYTGAKALIANTHWNLQILHLSDNLISHEAAQDLRNLPYFKLIDFKY